MSGASQQSTESFLCDHCQKKIYIHAGLPPITSPCPHCGKEVTSPDFSKGVSTPSAAVSKSQAAKEKPKESKSPEQKASAQSKGALIVESEEEEVTKGVEPEAVTQPSEIDRPRPALAGFILMLLAAGGAMLWWFYQQENKSPSGSSPGDARAVQAKDPQELWREAGWKDDANKVLAGFMEAQSPDQRMQYVIPNEGVLEELEMFYPEGTDDSGTLVSSFVHRTTGNEKDRKRGIFLMQYRQPAPVDIRENFLPLGSLDKILGVENATLIDMAHDLEDENLSQPIMINAYFKQTPEGLKLDASAFIQSKFRTFRAFVDYPRPGKKQVLRVAISESIEHRLRDDKSYRTYRLDDFAYPDDHINISIPAESELAKTLAVINWRGANRDPVLRYATVELGWSDQKPAQLQLERLICWEFLGVGGEIGNTALPPKDASEPSETLVDDEA